MMVNKASDKNVSDGNSFCAIEEGTGKMIGVAIASVNFTLDETVENNNVNILRLIKTFHII